MRIKLLQTLDVTLQIAVTIFEAEAQEKEMKLFMQTRKSAVLMMVHVVENLVTLTSSRELACGQKEGRNLRATEGQEDSRLSKYIAHQREASTRTSPCIVIIAVDRDTMLNTAMKLQKNGEIASASLILLDGRLQKYFRLTQTCLGETTI